MVSRIRSDGRQEHPSCLHQSGMTVRCCCCNCKGIRGLIRRRGPRPGPACAWVGATQVIPVLLAVLLEAVVAVVAMRSGSSEDNTRRGSGAKPGTRYNCTQQLYCTCAKTSYPVATCSYLAAEGACVQASNCTVATCMHPGVRQCYQVPPAAQQYTSCNNL